MIYGASKTRIRRFLRDPSARIWDDPYLLVTYNNVQRDMAAGQPALERVEALRVPPSYHFSHVFDWEWAYLPDLPRRAIKVWHEAYQSGAVGTHRWEVQMELGRPSVQAAEGQAWTHTWEAWMGDDDPALPVPMHFPDDFERALLVAYDREPLAYLDKKVITSRDSDWKTRGGEPIGYYREDSFSNQFYLFPRPSSVVFDDRPNAPDYIYTYAWEAQVAYIAGTGGKVTRTDSAAGREYVHAWEADGSTPEPGLRGMWVFELTSTTGAIVVHYGSDTNPDADGLIASRSGSLPTQEAGFAVDVVDQVDNVLLFYRALPTDLEGDGDESLWPEWAQKYIECGVLERAYGANTDGRIRSLQEYWQMRYELGMRVIDRWRGLRLQDRHFRLLTKGAPPNRNTRHPRLPDTYPRTP